MAGVPPDVVSLYFTYPQPTAFLGVEGLEWLSARLTGDSLPPRL